jgi:hypothetical protein
VYGGQEVNPAFPKPSQVKKKPEAVKVFRDGREVCNQLTRAGRDEYERRKRVMWERQGKRCCLEGLVDGCPGKLNWEDAAFEHEAGRGHGGGKRDDRIEINGKPTNGVAHWTCNGKKGSKRMDYNDVP